jgi:hypothetical protein
VNGRRVSVEEAHRRFVDEVNRAVEVFVALVREEAQPARQEREHPVKCRRCNWRLTWDIGAVCAACKTKRHVDHPDHGFEDGSAA